MEQESQNDYMHIAYTEEKSMRTYPQLYTNFLAVTSPNMSAI
jgi:hypothetical protein